MKEEQLGLAMVVTAGIALVAFAKTRPKENRLVLTWKKNSDGTCTFTYDDGSQFTGVCTEPPP